MPATARRRPALSAAELKRHANAEAPRAARYAVVGASSFVIDLGVYTVLVLSGVWYVPARALSLVAAVINGYTWNRLWTFRAGRHRNTMLAKYYGVQAGCLALNVSLLTLLVELAGLGKVVAAAVALPVVAAVSFLVNRFWTFEVR